MQERTVKAIIREALSLDAFAAPVINRKGALDEVFLYRDGKLQASIFSPLEGRIGVWRSDRDQVLANTPQEGVRRALEPQRKNTHVSPPNPSKTSP